MHLDESRTFYSKTSALTMGQSATLLHFHHAAPYGKREDSFLYYLTSR